DLVEDDVGRVRGERGEVGAGGGEAGHLRREGGGERLELAPLDVADHPREGDAVDHDRRIAAGAPARGARRSAGGRTPSWIRARCRPRARPSSRGAAYSVRTLSAHSTSETKIAGFANVAPFPARSVSRTPRALEHAPQTWMGTLCSRTLASASARGGQPT